MNLDKEILSTIQQIGALFVKKNIVSIPVDPDYLEVKIASGYDALVLKELMMYLEDLLLDYIEDFGVKHKYTYYAKRFRTILNENTSQKALIAQRSA